MVLGQEADARTSGRPTPESRPWSENARTIGWRPKPGTRPREDVPVAKKSKQHAHGATPATVALVEAGIDFTLHPYEHHDDATGFGEEAAEALGVTETRIFKTLVADVGGELVVAVVPVAQQLDLKALASCGR